MLGQLSNSETHTAEAILFLDKKMPIPLGITSYTLLILKGNNRGRKGTGRCFFISFQACQHTQSCTEAAVSETQGMLCCMGAVGVNINSLASAVSHACMIL